ncbi:unnamed protein product, partial [Cladocopium goreaui]
SEDFLPCSVALVRSIRQSQTVHEVTALVLPEISENAREQILEAGADQVVTAQEIQNPNEVVQYQAFAKNYAILRVWQLEELTKKAFHRAAPGRNSRRRWKWGMNDQERADHVNIRLQHLQQL